MPNIIWVAEDDENIRDLEIYTLKTGGFAVKGFEDGQILWEACQQGRPDLLILDAMLPGLDGFQLVERLRNLQACRLVPIIMATAKGNEADKVRALDCGADDYLVKPFSMIELVARVKAVLRRCCSKHSSFSLDGLILDMDAHSVSINGDALPLTYKEFRLLALFLANPGKAFSREQLLAKIWEDEYSRESRTVDMHIRSLRRKLGSLGGYIETVHHVGYRLSQNKCLKKSS